MKLSEEITKYWFGARKEFSPKLAAQIAQEITEIKNYADYKVILRTTRAKIRKESQQTAIRVFNRLVEAFFKAI